MKALDLTVAGLKTAGAVSIVGGALVLVGVGLSRWSSIPSAAGPAAANGLPDDIYEVIVSSPASVAMGFGALVLGYGAIRMARRLSRDRARVGKHPRSDVSRQPPARAGRVLPWRHR